MNLVKKYIDPVTGKDVVTLYREENHWVGRKPEVVYYASGGEKISVRSHFNSVKECDKAVKKKWKAYYAKLNKKPYTVGESYKPGDNGYFTPTKVRMKNLIEVL